MVNTHTKQLVKEWIPPIVLNLIRRNGHYFQSKDVRRSISSNAKFLNIHKGKRCFILATGPSISNQDLKPLADEICISVGEFYHHIDYSYIKPQYHVEAPMHPPYEFNLVENFLKNYSIYCKNAKHLFLGTSRYNFSFSRYLKTNADALKLDFSFINYDFSQDLNINNHEASDSWDITKTPFSVRTVVYSAIQIAAYMGCNEIYLLGCDHDYLRRYFDSNFVSTHFYKEEKSVLANTQANSAEFLDAFTLENWFKEYYYRWLQYRLMGEYLRKRGQTIYNATDGGMLDVFPRKRLSSLF